MCVSCAFSLLFIILNSALFAFLSTYLFFREREKDATQPGREVGRKWKKLWEEKTVIRIDCMKSFVFLANKKKLAFQILINCTKASTYLRTLVILKLLTVNSSQVIVCPLFSPLYLKMKQK